MMEKFNEYERIRAYWVSSPLDKIWTWRAADFPVDSTHRSRARLIAARVGDYARGTVARSGLGNYPSVTSLYPTIPQTQLPPFGLLMRCTEPSTPSPLRATHRRRWYQYDWLVNMSDSPLVWPWLSISRLCRQLIESFLKSFSLFSARFLLPSPLYIISFKLPH